MSNKSPVFYIGNVSIPSDVIFAPMAGYADVPTRKICSIFGSSMQYTEFVAVEDILNNSPGVQRLLDHDREEYPVVFQLFGNDAQKFLEAALRVSVLGPDIIDINMGCSTRRVSGRGAGVGMMPDLELIKATFSLLTKHLDIPITAKIRLGWDDHRNYLEVGRILEDCGAAAIAIHPRTKEQKYSGRANWKAIAELRRILNVPVIGNGDVNQARDINLMRKVTDCDAVMVGRAAIGNPWLLARKDKTEIHVGALIGVIGRHHRLMLGYYGQHGHIIFRKHVKHYLADCRMLLPYSRKLVQSDSPDQFMTILAEIGELFGSQTVADLAEDSPLSGEQHHFQPMKINQSLHNRVKSRSSV